jgi:hypothetical protein
MASAAALTGTTPALSEADAATRIQAAFRGHRVRRGDGKLGVSAKAHSSSPATLASAPIVRQKRSFKPILPTAEETFAAVAKTTALTATSYRNLTKQLGENEEGLRALEARQKTNDTPELRLELAEKRLEIAKLNNRLRKGKETGGEYHERMQDVLDARANIEVANVPTSAKAKDALLKAAHHRIQLTNNQVAKISETAANLQKQIDDLKAAGTEVDPKLLKQYASAVSAVVEANKKKNEALAQYEEHLDDPIAKAAITANMTARAEYIKPLEKFAALTSPTISDYETFIRETARVSPALKATRTPITDAAFPKTAKPSLAPQEPSPYEQWLTEQAIKAHDAKGDKKYEELDEATQYKIRKEYIRENYTKQMSTYASQGKEITGDRRGKSLVFQPQGSSAAVKVTQKFSRGPVTIDIDPIDGKLNTVLHIQRRGSRGELLEASDMIEIKDGRIVSIILSTDPDAGQSRLNMSQLKALQQKLDNGLARGAAAVQHAAPAPAIGTASPQPQGATPLAGSPAGSTAPTKTPEELAAEAAALAAATASGRSTLAAASAQPYVHLAASGVAQPPVMTPPPSSMTSPPSAKTAAQLAAEAAAALAAAQTPPNPHLAAALSTPPPGGSSLASPLAQPQGATPLAGLPAGSTAPAKTPAELAAEAALAAAQTASGRSTAASPLAQPQGATSPPSRMASPLPGAAASLAHSADDSRAMAASLVGQPPAGSRPASHLGATRPQPHGVTPPPSRLASPPPGALPTHSATSTLLPADVASVLTAATGGQPPQRSGLTAQVPGVPKPVPVSIIGNGSATPKGHGGR